MPQQLGLIAGRGAYPRLLAESARKQGVRRLFVVAFKKETDSVIEKLADEVRWIHLGQLGALLEAFRESGVAQAVMAGQIAPKHFFSVRMDAPLLAVIRRLRTVNAETLFAAIGEELKAIGVELLPAYLFMESAMPEPGPLGHRPLTEQERADVELGLRTAKAVSALEIGQTVVVKRGVILAVEAFEGTDETILRAGRLAGDGSVVVKVAKRGHDMRFDIPVVGERTLKVLKKAGASVLAVEARRTILLEREKIVQEADRQGLGLLAVEGDSP